MKNILRTTALALTLLHVV